MIPYHIWLLLFLSLVTEKHYDPHVCPPPYLLLLCILLQKFNSFVKLLHLIKLLLLFSFNLLIILYHPLSFRLFDGFMMLGPLIRRFRLYCLAYVHIASYSFKIEFPYNNQNHLIDYHFVIVVQFFFCENFVANQL